MGGKLGDEALDIIFREARTHNAWTDKPVPEEKLKALYDLMKWGPTSANMSPARIVFVTSKEAKAKLEPALMEGNRAKTMSAPVTASRTSGAAVAATPSSAPIFVAKACARAGSRPQTVIASSRRTFEMARAWVPACSP